MKPKILLFVLAGIFFLVSCKKEVVDDGTLNVLQKSAVSEEGIIESITIHFPSLEGNLLGDPADRVVNIYLLKSYASSPEKHFPEQTVLAIAGFMSFEDDMWAGMGAPAEPLPYNPFQSFKFANNSAYALAQAWLPNPEEPYLADLPFTFVDGLPVIKPELMEKWNAQNLIALVQKNKIGLKQLKTIYFDCGEFDDLGMYQPNLILDEILTEMNIKHQFETYPGTHISNLYDRLGKVWVKLSKGFPDYR